MSDKLSHVDQKGQARMVDVSAKEASWRKAAFLSYVELSPKSFALLEQSALPKGEVFNTARIAGIQAAKQTCHLIPMCHPIFLTSVDIQFDLIPEESSIKIIATAAAQASTGVEIEALVAAQTAAMTIYDMCKAVQKDILITNCRLLYKTGGKSGTYSFEDL